MEKAIKKEIYLFNIFRFDEWDSILKFGFSFVLKPNVDWTSEILTSKISLYPFDFSLTLFTLLNESHKHKNYAWNILHNIWLHCFMKWW